MSEYMMKVAGKTVSDTAKGLRVKDDGSVSAVRLLEEIPPTVILDTTEIRNTSAIGTTNVECPVYKYAVNAIVVQTTLNAAVNAILMDGSYLANEGYMRHIDGGIVQFDIPAKTGSATNYYIITADDLPEIDYIRFLKLRLQAKTTPTEGSIRILVMHKG